MAAETLQLPPLDVSEMSEQPGKGLTGMVKGHSIEILGRRQAEAVGHGTSLPPHAAGLECVILIDGVLAALYRFRDPHRASKAPRGAPERRRRMALSMIGMLIAFGGHLPPVAGAVFQDVILPRF